MAVSIPTVIASGDGQFNRQQDQSNASLLSLGGGTRRGNNYTLDGVSITDILNRAVANPSMESLDDVKVQVHTYDAEMGRTGGGVFNTTLRVRHQQLPRHRASSRPVRSGGRRTTTSASAPAGRSPTASTTSAAAASAVRSCRATTFFWFATENYHDIQSRSVSTAFPTAAERRGDFSRADQRRRAAGHHLRPADAAAVSRQHHPRRPHQSRRGGDRQLPAAARRRRRQRHQQLHAHGRDQQPFQQLYSDQGRAQVQRRRLDDRLLSLQPHRRAATPTTSRSASTAPPASPIPTTTC